MEIALAQVSHSSFDKTTNGFKSYMASVLTTYKKDMERYLSTEIFDNPGEALKTFNSSTYQHYLKLYNSMSDKYDAIMESMGEIGTKRIDYDKFLEETLEAESIESE